MYQQLASTAFLHVAYRPDSGLLIGRSPNATDLFQYARFIDEGAANAWLAEHRCQEGK